MMRTLAFAGLMATTVFGLAVNKRLNDYDFDPTPITWAVDVFQNGTIVNMTGTIQEIYAQIAKINPEFEPKVNLNTRKDISNDSGGPGLGVPVPLQDGEDKPELDDLCYFTLHNNQGWDPADEDKIVDGINYLRGVSGQPWSDPGPGKCHRVSCSYKSAIYWCNDHTDKITLPSYGAIADCADVANACRYYDMYMFHDVLGQHFTKDNWNCILRADDC